MKLKLVLDSECEVNLPLHYNKALQGFIYSNLDPTFSSFLHDYGFLVNNKSLRPITFSRIFGRSKIKEKRIIFEPPVYFYIASPVKQILSSFVINISNAETLLLGKNRLRLHSIEPVNEEVAKSEAVVKTLSPIVVRKTINGSSRFLSPSEDAFYEQLAENLSRKTSLYFKRFFSPKDIKIEPATGAFFKKAVVYYKGYPYDGYKGKFFIKAPVEAIKCALLAGLGERNSQGFGMVMLEGQ
jgi:CRISPR-associated endoribonuclease Cas6